MAIFFEKKYLHTYIHTVKKIGLFYSKNSTDNYATHFEFHELLFKHTWYWDYEYIASLYWYYCTYIHTCIPKNIHLYVTNFQGEDIPDDPKRMSRKQYISRSTLSMSMNDSSMNSFGKSSPSGRRLPYIHSHALAHTYIQYIHIHFPYRFFCICIHASIHTYIQ